MSDVFDVHFEGVVLVTSAEFAENPTDEQLVQAVRDGDGGAYVVLWGTHLDTALRAAESLSQEIDPEELVGEAFRSILGAIRSGHGPHGPFGPYLLATLRNTAAHWTERERRGTSVSIAGSRCQDDAVCDLNARLDEISRIGDVFRSLPLRQRMVLWYLHVEGLKPREIASLMSVRPNDVSAIANRAKASIGVSPVSRALRTAMG